jgi:BirA family biotin operon repressor/biotin-[acetyl-CoA-carboxylase] ligase
MKGESAGPCDVVVGVGLNVMFPKPFIDKIDQPWVDVASIKHPCPSRNELTAALISEIVLLLDRYQAQDTRALIDEWRRYDCVHGKMATLSTPNQSVFGRVMGVDNNGALLLSVRNEIRKYTSGEISMRIQP